MSSSREANDRTPPRPASDPSNSLLRVVDLQVSFRNGGVLVPVLDTVNLDIPAGSAIGLVGESGSGKTMLCRAMLGTLDRHGATVTDGQIIYDDQPLVGAGEDVWRQIRGHRIGYVPQSSLAGLNPLLTVRSHLREVLDPQRFSKGSDADQECLRMLDGVRIARPEQVLDFYPNQLSGGMRQRVMIALAIGLRPTVLVADEPTTALDVTIQREILQLLMSLRSETGMAIVLVSHDLAVIEELCEEVVVLYAGAAVESGPLEKVIGTPHHPYTWALSASRVDRVDPAHDLKTIAGDPVAVGGWPTGCRFWPRCPMARDDCREGGQPPLTTLGSGHASACLYPHEVGGLR
jgi:oligopeptide/dipeptide ABC transporter ATP-binding protein